MTPRSTSRRTLMAGWLSVALSACAYVSPSAVEDKVDSLDQDGDGAPLGGPDKDCDDAEPLVAPGLPEVPYDGLDNDCLDGDVVDADGDGFPGVLRADYPADADWPAGVSEDQVDCRDDEAAYPGAAGVFPGSQDAPYDGVDSDCGGDTDFDVDADGYLPDSFLLDGARVDTSDAFDAYVAEWGYDLGTPAFGDCDDFDDAVNPGVPATADEWYDGVDANCDLANDFDQDGDGWMPDEDLNATAYENFVDRYFDGAPPWGEAQWGDCLDAALGAIAADPASVYPGQAEAWYDGIDSDCLADNDFDQDGDGVMPDTVTGGGATGPAFDAFVAAWGYSFPEAYGDCTDTDPTVSPGALEKFGDALDGDCDGEADQTPWAFAGYEWEDPRPPIFVATDHHYVLTATATWVDLVLSQVEDTGLSILFERPDPAAGIVGAGYLATPQSTVLWQGAANPLPLGWAVDAWADGETFWVSTTYTASFTNLVAKKYEYEPALGTYVKRGEELVSTQYTYDATDVDVTIDAYGNPWATACAERTLVSIKGIGVLQSVPYQTLGDQPPNCDDVLTPCLEYGPESDVCFVGPPDAVTDWGTVTTCGAGLDCETWDFDAANEELLISAVQPFAGEALLSGDLRDDWYNLAYSGTGARVVSATGPESYDILRDWDLLSFDAVWHDGELWAVAVRNQSGVANVYLAHGNPAVDANSDGFGDLTTMLLPFEDPARPGLVPTAATLVADADRLAIAVAADHPTDTQLDAVGWVFLGWP